jgi:ribosome-associated translation inhibitor RaiA
MFINTGGCVEVGMSSDRFSLTPSLLQHIERRTRFAFSKIEYGIGSVAIHIRHLNSRLNDSPALKNKACRITVTLPGGYRRLVVREKRDDMYAAINAAISRAALRTSELLAQRRTSQLATVLSFPRPLPARQPASLASLPASFSRSA